MWLKTILICLLFLFFFIFHFIHNAQTLKYNVCCVFAQLKNLTFSKGDRYFSVISPQPWSFQRLEQNIAVYDISSLISNAFCLLVKVLCLSIFERDCTFFLFVTCTLCMICQNGCMVFHSSVECLTVLQFCALYGPVWKLLYTNPGHYFVYTSFTVRSELLGTGL